MKRLRVGFALLCALLLIGVGAQEGWAARGKYLSPRVTKSKVSSRARNRARISSLWQVPTFADPAAWDEVGEEDPIARAAALDALGRYNGSLIAVDANTGRILTWVNQPLALQDGFIPCSTIKIVVGLAGLLEGIIDERTVLRTSAGKYNLTQALAHSNNQYFEVLGRKLGFERVRFYARLFGLGEKAGLNIPGESPGVLPDEPPKSGGVGRMCSFGEGIRMTPLQLVALLGALANGGTLYYLQYPRSEQELLQFVPRVKRKLSIGPWVARLEEGLRGATTYGTAQRVSYLHPEPILGKTGTCTDYEKRAHMGWFGCYNGTGKARVAVVVMLTGGGAVNGPVASGVAARFFRNLSEAGFLQQELSYSPLALKFLRGCCAH